uniref:Calponin-homology (CH) domain-containing protein n=1 Tax=Electrophorus electricus TaxID=8005 RepID=A0AAY5EXH1_ELEEL
MKCHCVVCVSEVLRYCNVSIGDWAGISTSVQGSVPVASLCVGCLYVCGVWLCVFISFCGPCMRVRHFKVCPVLSDTPRDPFWFNEAWLGRIKEESADNWRLKVSNLKKILQCVMEYYHDVLGQQVAGEHVPEVSLIGELGDVTELGRMLQLVLGCAVSCEKKEEYIQQIMTLEESVQHVVMTAIQEVWPTLFSFFLYLFLSFQSRKYYFLSEDLEEQEGIDQRCRQLEQQLSMLMEEKSSLQAELQSLKQRLHVCESQDASTTITGKKLLLLQNQMEQLQEENYRLENSRDDLRVRGEVLEREMLELQQRNEELTSLAQDAQALRDEMDVLRHSSDRVGHLEALVQTYKRKLEDLGDLRRQVRLLEERNTVYMQRTCELEEELRRANAGRTQLDSYRRQVHELHAKHTSEAMKAEKWQFEYKNLNDKYEALLKEKERLLSERDTLRETNEELRCVQVHQQCLSQAGVSVSLSNLASEIMPMEFKETVLRLQHENKMLCAQEERYRQRLGETQVLLEEAQRSQNALQTQNRLNQQQIAQLSSQVEELQKALQEQDQKAENVSLNTHTHTHCPGLGLKLHEAHSDLQRKREVIDDLEPSANSDMAKKIDELQAIVRKKDEDMRQMEERCKHYVEKARTVIKTLDRKQKPHAVPTEIQALQNQLSERDRKIQHLEHDFEKTRSRHEQEEKLIISAWYNMGMALQQKVTGERNSSPGQAQSFLAQQRQSTQARRSLTLRLPPR